ncbi:hypothetical protein EF905_14445, partial [Streptomyces sp. WAC05374]
MNAIARVSPSASRRAAAGTVRGGATSREAATRRALTTSRTPATTVPPGTYAARSRPGKGLAAGDAVLVRPSGKATTCSWKAPGSRSAGGTTTTPAAPTATAAPRRTPRPRRPQ